jgi:hypothetical protein
MWLRPAGGEITEADDPVDAAPGYVGENGVEGDTVSVDFAD